MALPPTCKPLATVDDLADNSLVDVMGVVVDVLPPAMTSGRNYQAALDIRDNACLRDVRVKFFFPNVGGFQQPDPGDVVVISKIRKTTFSGQTILLFRLNLSRMVIFSVAKIPDQVIADSLSIPRASIRRYPKDSKRAVDEAEEKHAAALWQWALESGLPVSQAIRHRSQPSTNPTPVAVVPGKQPSLLKDVRHGGFYTLVGEVVKIFTRDFTSLYVTDYTMNAQFYSYIGKSEDDGQRWEAVPEGKHTLQITLWEPHAQHSSENVSVGSFVQLRNVRVLYRDETKTLEGKMHGDPVRRDRINVQVLEESSPLCKDLIARREAFNARVKADPGKNKKKREKRQRQKELRERSLAEPEAADPFSLAHRMDENRHIVAAFGDKPLHTLHSIIHSPHLHGKFRDDKGEECHITYPFMLAKFRAHVRVIDFYPPRLEDFSRSLADLGFNTCRAPEDWSAKPPQWEWAFYLLVEDANHDQKKERMKLLVAGPEAEYLLRLTASDLRRDVVNFKALREKLFFLWGELEEDKNSGDLAAGKPTKNKPFICCIQEYGVKGEGEDEWIRMHKMFSTTIKD